MTEVIGRRAVLYGLAGATLRVPQVAFAQSPRRVRRVVLFSGLPRWKDTVSDGLRDLGWVVGGPAAIRVAMKATATVPIVAIDLESDPVASGFVKSLARPGKNVSGIWMDLPQLAGKQLQFLRETVPGLRRVGVVWDDRIGRPQWTEAQSAARASNVSLQAVALHEVSETDDVVKRLLVERPQAILALTAPVVFRALSRLAELAIQHGLPSISPFSTYPDFGGLMAYGPDFVAMYRQTSSYVDRILRGANVGDLPVERPSKFVLILNVKTAKALGIAMPRLLLLTADQVIGQ